MTKYSEIYDEIIYDASRNYVTSRLADLSYIIGHYENNTPNRHGTEPLFKEEDVLNKFNDLLRKKSIIRNKEEIRELLNKKEEN